MQHLALEKQSGHDAAMPFVAFQSNQLTRLLVIVILTNIREYGIASNGKILVYQSGHGVCRIDLRIGRLQVFTSDHLDWSQLNVDIQHIQNH